MAALDFILSMTDHMSAGAHSASGALAKLEKSLKSAEDQLEMMQARAATGNNRITPAQILSYERLTNKISKTKEAIAALGHGTGGAEHASSSFFGKLVGAEVVGEVLSEGLMKVGEFALEAAKSIAEVGIELTKMALESSDAQRTLGIQMEALTGSAEAGKELVEQIEAIAATGIASSATLERMARGLAAAGYKGEELSTALKNIANTTALMGEDAGNAVTTLFEKIAAGGGKTQVAEEAITKMGLAGALKPGIVTAEQLNQALNVKFGGGAQKMALGFKAQMAGLQAKIEQLFDGAAEALEPFLVGLKDLLSIFDQNTASGKALKAAIAGAFEAILAAAKVALPLVKRFMQGLIIGALELVIFLAPAIKKLQEFLDLKPNDDLEEMFVMLGEYAVPILAVMAVSLAVIVVGLGALAAMAILCVAAILLIVGAAIAFSAAVGFAVAWAVAKLTELGVEAINAGLEFTNGLVDGITSGAGAVVQAVKNVADQAISGFKSKFGIASPSKVMAQMGEHMMSGFEVGVDRGGDGATSALSSAVDTRKVASGGASGGAGNVVNISFGDVNLSGGSSEQAAQFKAMVVETFEQLGLQLGAVS